MNALWDDFRTNHVSVPEWVEMRLWVTECKKHNISYPTLQLIQRIVGDGEGRGNQKFKILNVKICAGRESRRLISI